MVLRILNSRPDLSVRHIGSILEQRARLSKPIRGDVSDIDAGLRRLRFSFFTWTHPRLPGL